MGALAEPGPRSGAETTPEHDVGPEQQPEPPELRAVPDPGPDPEAGAESPEEAEEPRARRKVLLRPPDVWNTPGPSLAEEVARVRSGEHLPAAGPWRRAEQVRSWVSVLIIAALLLAVEANRSAGRQITTAAVLGALAVAFFH